MKWVVLCASLALMSCTTHADDRADLKAIGDKWEHVAESREVIGFMCGRAFGVLQEAGRESEERPECKVIHDRLIQQLQDRQPTP